VVQKDLGPALFLCCVFLAVYAVARGRVGMALAGFILLVIGFFDEAHGAANNGWVHTGGWMGIVTAAFVPIAAFAIWWTVRRIRKKHTAGED